MNELQKRQLNMALEVDRICKKHNLKYSICGGTLLGAVRHKGFIPWDDDLDLNMLRKDYDKFLEIAQKELNSKFFLQTNKTEKNYGVTFAKIRENNTTYIEEMSKNVNIHDGIYIDIFPLDNICENEKKANFLFKKVLILRMILLVKCKYTLDNKTLFKKIAIILLKFLSLFTTKNYLLRKIHKIEKKYKDVESNKVIAYGTNYFNKFLFDRDLYNEHTEYEFEGHKLLGLKNYDKYLSYLYGDYMTPPPKKERENYHGIIKTELNKKSDKNN